MQLTMNLTQAKPEDILNVSNAVNNGRQKVDLIKRKVGKKIDNSTTYLPIGDVAKALQKTICYEKRRNNWHIPTEASLYNAIRHMADKGEISKAFNESITKRGKPVILVAYSETRRHLLNKNKWDLQVNRDHKGMERNGPKYRRRPKTFFGKLIRWIKLFRKEVL